MSVQYAEEQRVPYIPLKSRTRPNNTLDPDVRKFLGWVEYFELVTKPNMVEFVILGPILAQMALARVARTKSGGDRRYRTTITDSRSE